MIATRAQVLLRYSRAILWCDEVNFSSFRRFRNSIRFVDGGCGWVWILFLSICDISSSSTPSRKLSRGDESLPSMLTMSFPTELSSLSHSAVTSWPGKDISVSGTASSESRTSRAWLGVKSVGGIKTLIIWCDRAEPVRTTLPRDLVLYMTFVTLRLRMKTKLITVLQQQGLFWLWTTVASISTRPLQSQITHNKILKLAARKPTFQNRKLSWANRTKTTAEVVVYHSTQITKRRRRNLDK